MSFHDTELHRLTYGAKPKNLSESELVESHLPLVRKLAWHVHGRISNAIDAEDLIQIGMVSLVEAAKGYEDRGLGFSNYAKLRVRGAMIDHLRKLSNLTRSAMTFRKKVRDTQKKLFQQLGYAPDETAVAKDLGMDQESFRIAVDQADSIDLKSMDEVYSDQNIWFEDQTERADDAVQRSQMTELLGQAIASLPEREAMILQLYFNEEMNLDEIGKTLDIGAARVCQIKKAALGKLKKLMADHQ